MFTMKKIAFLGLAAMTAFTMSCSDSDSDDNGGEPGGVISDFSASYSTTLKKVVISGEIVANESDLNAVSDVKVFADETEIPTTFTLGKSVEFTDKAIENVCALTSTATDKEFTISIVASFVEGGDVQSEGKKVNVPCSQNAIISWASFTLSNAGESFADLDIKKTYKGDAAVTAGGIDVFAHAAGAKGTNCAANKICPLWDSFEDGASNLGGDVTGDGESYMWLMPANANTQLEALTPGTQIDENFKTWTASLSLITNGDPVAAGDISTTNWVLVQTTTAEGNSFFVIRATSTGTNTATFKAFGWKATEN